MGRHRLQLGRSLFCKSGDRSADHRTGLFRNKRTQQKRLGRHSPRQLSKVGRSSLSFELPLGFEEAAAYRKANGQYVRKNQWRDTTVTVYIDLD